MNGTCQYKLDMLSFPGRGHECIVIGSGGVLTSQQGPLVLGVALKSDRGMPALHARRIRMLFELRHLKLGGAAVAQDLGGVPVNGPAPCLLHAAAQPQKVACMRDSV